MLNPLGFNIANATREGICGCHTGIPRCWLNFRELLWSVALSLAFKALLGWEIFSLLISNLDPPLEIGQSVEENSFVDRTLYAHCPPCCLRLFIQAFLRHFPPHWTMCLAKETTEMGKIHEQLLFSGGDQTSDHYICNL